MEDFSDVFPVIFRVVRVNEDVIEVGDDRNVEHVAKYVVDETLKSGESIGEAEGHDEPFERTVSGAEGGFPFISFSDPDEVISVSEVDLGVDMSSSGAVQEVGDE